MRFHGVITECSPTWNHGESAAFSWATASGDEGHRGKSSVLGSPATHPIGPISMLQSGSREIPETRVSSILMFMLSFGPLFNSREAQVGLIAVRCSHSTVRYKHGCERSPL